MKKYQSKQHLDVEVMRGADCWTDYQMVGARVNIKVECHCGKRIEMVRTKRVNMRLLLCDEVVSLLMIKR